MLRTEPLPDHLVTRYRTWKSGTHTPGRGYFRALVDSGQHPTEMIISCCDSRVHVTRIFSAETGEMFIHRNVAALVPPCEADGEHHGTSAAVEYAVRVLGVSRLIVLGHSNCGGVQGCYDMCRGAAPELDEMSSFVGRWMDLLKRGYERLPQDADEPTRLRLLEKEAVIVSLENLMTFPWLADAVAAGRLALHGLWTDIAEGTLETYDAGTGRFAPV